HQRQSDRPRRDSREPFGVLSIARVTVEWPRLRPHRHRLLRAEDCGDRWLDTPECGVLARAHPARCATRAEWRREWWPWERRERLYRTGGDSATLPSAVA